MAVPPKKNGKFVKAPAKKAAKKVDKKANAADKKKMETAAAKQRVLNSFHKFLGS